MRTSASNRTIMHRCIAMSFVVTLVLSAILLGTTPGIKNAWTGRTRSPLIPSWENVTSPVDVNCTWGVSPGAWYNWTFIEHTSFPSHAKVGAYFNYTDTISIGPWWVEAIFLDYFVNDAWLNQQGGIPLVTNDSILNQGNSITWAPFYIPVDINGVDIAGVLGLLATGYNTAILEGYFSGNSTGEATIDVDPVDGTITWENASDPVNTVIFKYNTSTGVLDYFLARQAGGITVHEWVLGIVLPPPLEVTWGVDPVENNTLYWHVIQDTQYGMVNNHIRYTITEVDYALMDIMGVSNFSYVGGIAEGYAGGMFMPMGPQPVNMTMANDEIQWGGPVVLVPCTPLPVNLDLMANGIGYWLMEMLFDNTTNGDMRLFRDDASGTLVYYKLGDPAKNLTFVFNTTDGVTELFHANNGSIVKHYVREPGIPPLDVAWGIHPQDSFYWMVNEADDVMAPHVGKVLNITVTSIEYVMVDFGPPGTFNMSVVGGFQLVENDTGEFEGLGGIDTPVNLTYANDMFILNGNGALMVYVMPTNVPVQRLESPLGDMLIERYFANDTTNMVKETFDGAFRTLRVYNQSDPSIELVMTFEAATGVCTSFYYRNDTNMLNLTLITTPGQVTGLVVTPGNGVVNLTWAAPASGGSPITGYTVHWSTDGVAYTAIEAGNVTSFQHAGLDDNQVYYYKVSASNVVGSGSNSTVGSATTWNVPGQVTGLVVTPGNGVVNLTWAAPASGGSPITGYTVHWSTDGVAYTAIEAGNVTSFQHAGLDDNQVYYYKVSASNVVGSGSNSTVGSATTWNVPGQVTGLVVTPGNGVVNLTWAAPASGGSPITGYTVHWSTDGVAYTAIEAGNVTSFQHAGLDDNQVYYYKVSASNVVGSGSNSTVGSATTWNVPGQVTGLVITSGDGQVTLTWTAPASGGSPITGYNIYRNGTLLTTTASGTTTTFTDTGLVNGMEYRYSVAAVNVMGEGTPSEPATGRPAEPPGIAGYEVLLVALAVVATCAALVSRKPRRD